ncbi:hypothetical protein M3484_16510 [Pseudomonas sp. GX19020]|uniref:hypothetical protein n=1 Tax=Pseudomonas sp. GX19020 TaxID=2942277 RepID=UPI0020187256|nr:hypothetical protein [Pseudomonas sp. GX19020]MCL4068175.1 hypothetical protein [Pseudomonas sp. GX19020]
MTNICRPLQPRFVLKHRAILIHGDATRWAQKDIALFLLHIIRVTTSKSCQGRFSAFLSRTKSQLSESNVKNWRQGRHAALLRQVWNFCCFWRVGCHFLACPAILLAGVGGCLLTVLLATSATADGWKSGSSFDTRPVEPRAAAAGSSFAGLVVASSFDAPSNRVVLPVGRTEFLLPTGSDALVKLRALIQHAESRRAGYDAWHESARIPPPKLPSQMTLAEIQSWIAATPGQHHAIGRYQIVPDTLERLIHKTGLPADALFDAPLQDTLANVLIMDAGYSAFATGQITPSRFMDNLARVWAGFPLESGLSAYDGVAGNKATVSRAFYAEQMALIFPVEWARIALPNREAGES